MAEEWQKSRTDTNMATNPTKEQLLQSLLDIHFQRRCLHIDPGAPDPLIACPTPNHNGGDCPRTYLALEEERMRNEPSDDLSIYTGHDRIAGAPCAEFAWASGPKSLSSRSRCAPRPYFPTLLVVGQSSQGPSGPCSARMVLNRLQLDGLRIDPGP